MIGWALKILRISRNFIWGMSFHLPFSPSIRQSAQQRQQWWVHGLTSLISPAAYLLAAMPASCEMLKGGRVETEARVLNNKPLNSKTGLSQGLPEQTGRGRWAPLGCEHGCQSMGKHHGIHWPWQGYKSSGFTWINATWTRSPVYFYKSVFSEYSEFILFWFYCCSKQVGAQGIQLLNVK